LITIADWSELAKLLHSEADGIRTGGRRPPTMTEAPTKKHRRIGLSVRLLMAIVVILGGGFGWLAYHVRVQREAVEAIERGGGKVYYDWQLDPDGRFDPKGMPPAPGWLVRIVGSGAFGHVERVIVGRGEADATMAWVARLGRVKELRIFPEGSLTDGGMIHLRALTRLERLSLLPGGSPPRITGAWLQNLTGLSRLRYLSIRGIPVTDDDLQALAGLGSLKDLDLSSTRITGAGLSRLVGLDSLESLTLDGTAITDEGMRNLMTIPSLVTLSLNWTRVTEAGLWHLVGLKRLKRVSVIATLVSSRKASEFILMHPRIHVTQTLPVMNTL
jgi:hypothetical protein